MTRIEIIEAFENTKYFNKMYWIKTLNQRAGLLPNGAMNPNRAGSYYPNHSSPSLEKSLIAAYWSPFDSENVRPGFKCFSTAMPGISGIIDLNTLAPTSTLKMGDIKKTGYANLYIESGREVLVDATTVIISQKSASWNVVTFFPGNPIQGIKIPWQQISKNEVSVSEAKDLGFTHAKMIKSSMKND